MSSRRYAMKPEFTLAGPMLRYDNAKPNLQLLDKVDLKRLRRASKACANLVTPSLFREVLFDLEPGGLDQLVAIARHPGLRLLPRILHLRRRRGLKGFQAFEHRQRATVYEYESLIPNEDAELILPHMMTHSEWAELSEDVRWRLYEEYEAEQRATYVYASTFALSVARTHGSVFENDDSPAHSDPARGDRTVETLLTALDGLTAVTTFTHTPAYEWDAAWSQTWRRVQFHTQGLSGLGNDEYDADCDALQLFVALCVVSNASNSLRSSSLFTRGSAFWGVPSLHRLIHRAKRMEIDDDFGLSNPEDDFTRNDLSLSSHISELGGPLALMHRTESLTRQLVTWERSFSRLTSVECRVETNWLERSDARLIVATQLSNGLRNGTTLEELHLVYRADAATDDPPWYMHGDGLDQLYGSNEPNLSESKQISQCILGALMSGCAHLRSLHLSLETSASDLLALFARLGSLRHLELFYVVLLPDEGHWESILEAAAEHLHLDTIALRSLVDFCGTQTRCILHPEAPAFRAGGPNENLYKPYEDTIIDFVLRRSDLLPHLSEKKYLRSIQAQ
ncbi:hypothetical protein LTR56_025893 [Elasticomyces elasticus]|nr:hypothetical protein LTR56_025893 [Elasticomyces elasticus]KAK5742706.1 hypothetical protein LTS12_024158 [Elasticomyces elasticus]